MKTYSNLFEQIISTENLFLSWDEFRIDKKKKEDVLLFEKNLEQNILELHRDLKYHTYKHAVYSAFTISDPKPRHIHKATVRDRIVHHAIYRTIYPIFDRLFIADSYACRLAKGTHRAVKRLEGFTKIVSRNYSRPCFVLKCDVKKFFDSVDHDILLNLLKKKISDVETINLLKEIIESFHKPDKVQLGLFDLPPANREREREYFGKLSFFAKRDTNRQFNIPIIC